MSKRLEQLLSVVLTLAAVAIAAVLVRREFFSGASSARPVTVDPGPPRFVAEWKEILRYGTRVGSDSASVVLLEFGDLECPFCRRFHQQVLKPALDTFGPDLAFVYVDFPIPGHRFARPAFRAAQCARAQGKFAEYVNVTYATQDSLGLKPWVAYALEAGVPDSAAFQRCLSRPASPQVADSGVAIGGRIGVRGTPTVLLNGWLFPTPPSDSALIEWIKRSLHERSSVRPLLSDSTAEGGRRHDGSSDGAEP